MDSLVNLLSRQTTTTHRHIVTMEDLADRPPLDTKPGTQLIHRLPRLISGDECPDLVCTKLTGPAGFGAIGGRWRGSGGGGKLPTQGFQGFYLGFKL